MNDLLTYFHKYLYIGLLKFMYRVIMGVLMNKKGVLYTFLGILLVLSVIFASGDSDGFIRRVNIEVEQKSTFSAEPQTFKSLSVEFDEPQEKRVLVIMKEDVLVKSRISGELNINISEDSVRHKFSSVNGFSASLSQEEIDELKNDDDVEDVIELGFKKLLLTDSVDIINASDTWQLQYGGMNLTGKGQTVCVIDTGVNYSHPDLGGCFGAGCKVIAGYDFADNNADPMDDDGHGTHVAGIVAANGTIIGVAPSANIAAVDVFKSNGRASDDDIAAGIEWCVNNSATYNISVITMSLGADCFSPGWTGLCYSSYCDANEPLLAPAIDLAIANNIPVLVASGNDALCTHISSPSCIENAIPIGATAKNDSIALYSNANSLVQLFATGSSIVSADIDGGGTTKSGTSMATPHVAGAFAIMNQYLGAVGASRTPAQIESLFNSTGKRILDTCSGLTFSRINVSDTILSIDLTNPSLVLGLPVNDTEQNDSFVSFNFTADDDIDDVLTCYLYINGVLNETINATAGVSYTYNVTYLDGVYYWYVMCVDDSENSNTSELRVLKVDTAAPVYINRVMSPARYRADENYFFNVTWIDTTNISNALLNFNGVNYTMLSDDGVEYYRSSSSTPSFAVASDTVSTYYFWANDSFGMINISAMFNFSIIFPAASQTLADTESINVGDNISEILVPTNSVLRNVTVNSTNTVYLNLSPVVSSGRVTIPNNFTLTRQASVNYTAFIPAGTQIIGDAGWNKTISLPIIRETDNYSAPSGRVNAVIDVGSSIGLNFTNPVKIVIGGMAGKRAAWSRGAGQLTAISRECDDVEDPTNINNATRRECYIDSGDDLIIWTYHFTEFAAYTPRSGGGGGGGGGGGSSSIVNYIEFEGNEGYVIGGKSGKTYSFTVDGDLKTIKIMSVQSPYVNFVVESPIAFMTIYVSGTTKVDFDSDGEHDIEVKLLSIGESNTVSFKVTINDGSNELVPFTASAVASLLEDQEGSKGEVDVNNTPPVIDDKPKESEKRSNSGLVIAIVAFSLAFIVFIILVIVIALSIYSKREIKK